MDYLNENDSEVLFEFAQVRVSNNKFNIMLAVNPDSNRISEAYFKMYNSDNYMSATKVARISFFRPILISHKGSKKPWNYLNSKQKEILIEYLNSESKNYPKYKVWDVLKYTWNDEHGYCSGTIDDYYNGADDNKIKTKSYIPSKLEIPNYKNIILE